MEIMPIIRFFVVAHLSVKQIWMIQIKKYEHFKKLISYCISFSVNVKK